MPQEEPTARMPQRIESFLANLFLGLLFVALSIAAAEAMARFYLTHYATEDQFLLFASERQLVKRFGTGNSKFVPHPYMGVIPRPGWSRGLNRHNSLGFRGDEFVVSKPVGEFRIVCLGGSTTYTSAVEDYHLSYPAQLEVQLRPRHGNIRVINGGTSDWTTWETLISFETRVLDLSPDVVIVYDAINDLEARIVWPPESYRGDNSGSRVSPQHEVNMPSVLEYSTMVRYVFIRRGRTLPHARMGRIIDRPPTSLVNALRPQLQKGTYPAPPFNEIPLEKILAANPPIYFRRNLEHLIVIAQLRGVRVVLATMATAPVEAHLVFGSALDVAGIEEMNDVTRSIARERGVSLFDFAKAFPKDVRWFADGVHLNEEGARLQATYFAQFLERDGIVR